MSEVRSLLGHTLCKYNPIHTDIINICRNKKKVNILAKNQPRVN